MTTNERIGGDLRITKTTRRAAGAGTWVCGRLNGHRFEALVFPEHAENPEWEIGDSRISKLRVERLADRQTVFNWDRGLDLSAANPTVQAIVDFLAARLADRVYAVAQKPEERTVDFPSLEFATPADALRFARANRPVPILLDGKALVVSQEDADGLAAAGVEFAYLHERDGRIVTVPVND
jgi:hypothetical protein